MSIDKEYRKEGLSWWPQEQPTKVEEDYGIDNLIKHNMKVDYVITHTAPQSIVYRIIKPVTGPYDVTSKKIYDPHSTYLEYIFNSIEFKEWIFGHFHENLEFDGKFRCLYKSIYRLV